MSAVRLPGILWAQRKDKLFLTIDLQDSDKPDIRLDNDDEKDTGKVIFKGKAKSHATGSDYHEYELEVDLLHAVDTKESKISVNARNVVLVIAKKAGDETYWPRLLKDKAKATNVKVDWDRWVDEDEEEGEESPGFDLSNLQDFSNFDTSTGPLAGAGDDEDSDDEELPELENA